MNVNKKNLAEMFNVDPRTIERWQTQGLPQISGGGKGIEIIFDSAKAIEWYAQREADIENEKLRKEVEDLRAASETDLQPGTIDYERYRLTKAQADAQELKNARDSGQVIDTGFCMYALARLAQDISGILDSIPLYMQRQFPEFPPSALEFLKSEIAKASNKCADTADGLPDMLADYIRESNS
ncbi:terminase small subunit [Escherichia coli]|jgi:phage terminase Nu1 subunit (DNA packaging protein)|uniref:terminase small subunit n=1 Tax=Escherichia coli TaxID=562 RepID=UPI000224337B|nr:terminase small subunit [Escherichia coli]ELQ0717730.1 terminase small subunit [Escherichia coli O8]EMA1622869.1 terminase small subunit [Escherichia coli O103]HDQ6582584.1 terminase small subunit [Escherichia coli O146:H21]HDQ6622046.1 terminase small subunit [Escherichia coli O128:H2]HDQ6701533.1 terminase small subunit [Escherichia coli O174:H8]HDQ6804375.1 terminase small subunit [Escherichia coli O22:H16]HDQ6922685.1 terminase small subunit [Escherichia coli O128AB:H2]